MSKFLTRFLLIGLILGLLVVSGQVFAERKPKILERQEGKPIFNIADVPEKYLKQKLLITETAKRIHVLIKAAQITEISSDLLKVKIFGQDYKIQISSDTNIISHSWGKSDLSEFSVGDIINVRGTLDLTDPLLVKAKTVRNVSIQKKHTVFSGEITAISTVTPPTDFTLKTVNRGLQKVVLSDKTKIYEGKVEKTASDLQVGMKVLVRGIWNEKLSQIQALLIRIKPAEVTP